MKLYTDSYNVQKYDDFLKYLQENEKGIQRKIYERVFKAYIAAAIEKNKFQSCIWE